MTAASRRRSLAACCALLAIFPAVSGLAEEDTRRVTWSDLKAKVVIEDPFDDLSDKQLLDLGLISRVQSLQEQEGSRPVSKALLAKATEARRRFEKQGLDVEDLFAKRKELTELRRQRARATVPELDGRSVALSGFVLPLEYQGKRVTEFLLVPWVGACIHTPPPPPNQIVHVVAGTPFETKGLFEAVTVTGAIEVGNRKKNLFLVDGSADISLSYAMHKAGVTKYDEK